MLRLIPSDSEFEMKQLTISQQSAHIIWTSKSVIAEIPFGTDTFLIENDKIKVHTVAALVIYGRQETLPITLVLLQVGLEVETSAVCCIVLK